MARKISYSIGPEENGKKVYDCLRHAGLSYRLITSLKHVADGMELNGVHTRTIDHVRTGDVLTVSLPDADHTCAPSELVVPVVYEDEDVLVYDKPAGMNCHQSRRVQNDTLSNVFAAHCLNAGISLTFRCPNRLDKDTSGLVLLAKNQHAAALIKFAVNKDYTALVHGVLQPQSGTVDVPIARMNEVYTKRLADPYGQTAITHYTVLAAAPDSAYCLVRLLLETGRTHQIRVHMAHIGHPLAGDDMYGGTQELLPRQALHCGHMWFTSPITGKAVDIICPLPQDMQKALSDAKIYSNYA